MFIAIGYQPRQKYREAVTKEILDETGCWKFIFILGIKDSSVLDIRVIWDYRKRGINSFLFSCQVKQKMKDSEKRDFFFFLILLWLSLSLSSGGGREAAVPRFIGGRNS